MGKYKNYTLYAKIEGRNCEKYTVLEAVHEDRKRGLELMSGHLIEDLDRMTSKYESYEDLLLSYPLEVYGEYFKIYEPVIIVDKDEQDRKKSYAIYEIVFAQDALEIADRNNIRIWLLDFLQNNPERILEFRGIGDIYTNMKRKYPSMGTAELINNTVRKYFEDNNYKRYREAYFRLKELDYKRVKRNEIH